MIRNIRFVGNLFLNTCTNFFDDDVMIVTSSAHRTQFTRVLFSPPVIYHTLQVTNNIWTEKIINLTSQRHHF